MKLNCRAKNEGKRSSHSGVITCKRIKQSDLQRECFGQKLNNQTFKLLKITESFCSFHEGLLICKDLLICKGLLIPDLKMIEQMKMKLR